MTKLTHNNVSMDIPAPSNFTNNTGFISQFPYSSNDIGTNFVNTYAGKLMSAIEINWGNSYCSGSTYNFTKNTYINTSLDVVSGIFTSYDIAERGLNIAESTYVNSNENTSRINSIYNQLISEFQYLTFIALEDDTKFSFTTDIYYSIDDGITWRLLNNNNTVTIQKGKKIMWRKNSLNILNNSIGQFSADHNFKIRGNIMSLIYKDEFIGKTNLNTNNIFSNLFNNCQTLIDAEELILPATELTQSCYAYMFYHCISLTKAPELPATQLAPYCYQHMFTECPKLTKAPELPATQLAPYCYNNMFYTAGIKNAPTLYHPRIHLLEGCYASMFANCKNLTEAPELRARTLAKDCYASMFTACTNLTKAPELPATNLVQGCYNYMFAGCKNLTKAPELPATQLEQNCYSHMFYGCTSLNYIKMMATTISANSCMSDWVYGVASTGTFIKNARAQWNVIGNNGIPEGWKIYTEAEYEVVHHYELLKDYPEQYLTIEALEDNTKIYWCLTFYNIMSNPTQEQIDNYINTHGKNIYVSYDGITWREIQHVFDVEHQTLGGIRIEICQLNKGQKILIKGDSKSCSTGKTSDSADIGNIYCNYFDTYDFSINDYHKIKVYGNIMSIIYGDNFIDKTSFENENNNYVFGGLFMSCSGLIDAENLILPVITLSRGCYNSMFYNCTNLTKAPELPAITLAEECYEAMFSNCTSLTEAPKLPATTLVEGCYTAMFYGCSNLNYIKAMFTTEPGTSYTMMWVYEVAPKGLFIKNETATWNVSNDDGDGIPKGWICSYLDSDYLPIRRYELDDLLNSMAHTLNALNNIVPSDSTAYISVFEARDELKNIIDAYPIYNTSNTILEQYGSYNGNSYNGNSYNG